MKPLLLVAALLASTSAAAQEAIYVVRHAERADESPDSELSTRGVGRAYQLRDLLRDAGITRIFTSELRRTIDTAKPIADAKHLTPVVVPGADGRTLAARIAASGARDRVLVVGHSNTVPELLRALGVDSPIALGDNDYDNLFIVVPQKDGRPMMMRLRY